MPITREEFEQGSDETDELILRMLSANPDKAFSINEIVGVIYGDPPADVMDIILRIPRLLIGFWHHPLRPGERGATRPKNCERNYLLQHPPEEILSTKS